MSSAFGCQVVWKLECRAVATRSQEETCMIYPQNPQGQRSIARHYDELTEYYLRIWGEHLHHGLWESGNETTQEAVCRLVQELAKRTDVGAGEYVCDIGCGYGATARLLAHEYGARVVGVTISQAQYSYACSQYVHNANPRYLLGDWSANDFPNDVFDVALSIESSEHMADKPAFFSEVNRVLRPGGRLGLCAWMARESPNLWEVNHILEPICSEGRLPSMCSEADYRTLLRASGLEKITFEDLSRKVCRTWSVCAWRVVKLAFTDNKARRFLLRGPEDRMFVRAIARIWLAFRLGSMRYGLFVAHKPAKAD